MHADAPISPRVDWPKGHDRHDVIVEFGAYSEGPHLMHVLDPSLGWFLPGVQGRQKAMPWPVCEYPAGQL